MAVLSKAQILAAEDVPRERVDVPEWGGEVWVYGFGATLRDLVEAKGMLGKVKDDDGIGPLSLICAMTICDETGNRLFTNDEVEDLGKKNAKVLANIAQIAVRLSGMREEDLKDLKKG